MRYLQLLLVLLAINVAVVAQTHDSYKQISCVGLIPEDFLPEGARKLLLNNANEQATSGKNKLFTNFNLKSTYSAYNVLVSGYVIYGTPLNDYVNAVADKLMENDMTTRKKLKIYVFESSQVNAFTFNNGVILINIGLFAKLNNESELAFVLAHEIAHYTKSHAFNAYRKQRVVEKKSERVSSLNVDREEVEYYRFSKEQETEADKLGFERFVKTGYKLTSSLTLLDVLARSAWPFQNKTLTKDFLDSKYLVVPAKYYNDSAVKSLKIDTSYNDSKQTHPAIPKRKAAIVTLLNKAASDTSIGKKYLVSQDKFEQLRQQCRMELSRLYMHDKEYFNSIYNSYLLADIGDDEYLTTIFVKNLYFIQFNFNERSRRDVTESEKNSEGEVSRLNTMFKNFSKEELNAWCLRKAWDAQTKYPNNNEIKVFTLAITKGFKQTVAQELKFFAPLAEYNDSLIQSFYKVTALEVVAQKRQANGNRKSSRIHTRRSGTFVKYCMPDYILDERFTKAFNEIEVPKAVDEEEDEDEIRPKKVAKNKKKKEEQLVFDSGNIIIADLTNIKLDQTKDEPVMYTAMQKQSDNLLTIVKDCANRNDVGLTMMLPDALQEEDSTLFKDRNTVLKYINERAKYEGNEAFYCSEHNAISEVASRYNTKYVAVVNILGVLRKKDYKEAISYVCYSILYPPILTLTLYNIIKRDRASYLSFVVYDVTTGKKVYTTNKFFSMNSHDDLIKSEFYNFFYKFKGK